jgi:hypothetical protein
MSAILVRRFAGAFFDRACVSLLRSLSPMPWMTSIIVGKIQEEECWGDFSPHLVKPSPEPC